VVKTSVYVGTSVDGFIARRDDGLDFLESAEPVDGDMGFGDFMASVDVMVMGRNTFEVLERLVTREGVDWPYGETPLVVLTGRDLDVPVQLREKVQVSDLEPAALMEELARRGFEHAYIDGGAVIQSFLRAGLIDELIITSVPVLIGNGISLFGWLDADLTLEHAGTTVFENGCVQTRYLVSAPPIGTEAPVEEAVPGVSLVREPEEPKEAGRDDRR
jgi:dihydrofolate reductase